MKLRGATTFLAALAALGLIAPAAAGATPVTLAPPGNSAIGQYLEVVPGDTGATPPRSGGSIAGGGGAAGGHVGGQGGIATPLSAAQRGRLGQLGAGGRTLLAVVDGTAPAAIGAAPSVAARRRSPEGRTAGLSEARQDSSHVARMLDEVRAPSAGSLLLSAADGGGAGGLGPALPAMALVSAAAAGAYAIRRRRSRS